MADCVTPLQNDETFCNVFRNNETRAFTRLSFRALRLRRPAYSHQAWCGGGGGGGVSFPRPGFSSRQAPFLALPPPVPHAPSLPPVLLSPGETSRRPDHLAPSPRRVESPPREGVGDPGESGRNAVPALTKPWKRFRPPRILPERGGGGTGTRRPTSKSGYWLPDNLLKPGFFGGGWGFWPPTLRPRDAAGGRPESPG